MPSIVTSIHDPLALLTACRQFGVPAPYEGSFLFDGRQVPGWVIRLRGVNLPIVCDTLTGLIAYHPRDNAFVPYQRIMRFVQAYYAVRHQLRQRGVLASRLRRAAA